MQWRRLGKSKIYRAVWQAGDQGKHSSSSSRVVWWQNSFLPRGGSILCSIKAFNRLDEANPHNGGQHALLKVRQFTC